MTQAALEALVLLAVSKNGDGGAKGKNCTIKSIEAVDGGSKVTFAWTSDSGDSQTSSMIVKDGKSIESFEKSISDHLLVNLNDGTQLDAGLLPSGEKGDPGDSAYDVAVSNGFLGTEAEWLDSLKGDDGSFSPELEEQLNQNTADIATLKGTGEGSVSKAVADGIADVVANAPSDFDTLKEIADYIASDKTNATEMSNAISGNTSAISRLEQSIGNLEAAVQNAEYDDTAISARVTAVEGLLDGHSVGVDVPSDAVFTDTVYDDTTLVGRLQTAENEIATLKMNGYDDTAIVGRIQVAEGNIEQAQSSIATIQAALDGHTVRKDVPSDAVFTDTIYDDTAIQSSITVINTALSNLSQVSDDSARDVDELKSRVSINETAINVLNGTGDGSVSKTVTDKVAEIVAGAPEDFDTLKEIADYIASDKTNATEINNTISHIQSSITTIQVALGGHTIGANVPADAVFTDTVYDDTELRTLIGEKVSADDVASALSDYIAKDDLEPVDMATITGWFTS